MATMKKDEGIATVNQANIVRTTLRIVGTAPLVVNNFSFKARQKMMDDMQRPANQKKAKTARPPRDYDSDFMGARHLSEDGWDGISAPAFRTAMIDACRTVGLVMTKAKMSVFVVADGIDKQDGTPLVRIIADAPERMESLVRNDNGGADIRIRPMWRKWSANITLDFDADMITADSVANLLDRAGRQVGVGEGRPFSKNSTGQGWGTFQIVGDAA